MDVWQDVVKAALIGSDRQPFALPALVDSPLANILAQLDASSPAAHMLQVAGVLALHRQASWTAPQQDIPLPEPCDRTDLPCCSAIATQLLEGILTGDERALLPEWLNLAAQAGQRVSPEMLPKLLDVGRQNVPLRPAILFVLGKRGQWLAAQNDSWDYARDRNHLDVRIWETGTTADRLALLTQVCDRNPQQGRELIQSTWKTEAAEFRSACLKIITPTLDAADEAWLTKVFASDRSRQVRQDAAELLIALPMSELGQQVQNWAEPLLDFQSSAQTAVLNVHLPTTFTPEMEKLGLQRRPPAGIGEKAGWLQQLLARVPPSHWCDRWQTTPEQLLSAVDDQWQPVVLYGWMKATKLHRDLVWATALLDNVVQQALQSNQADIFIWLDEITEVLSPTHLVDTCLSLIQHPQPTNMAIEVLFSLLDLCQTAWPLELTESVIALFCDAVQNQNRGSNYYFWQHRLLGFACYIQPEHYDLIAPSLQTAIADHDYFAKPIDDCLGRLAFRQRLHQAFITP
ncbi:MAG: DUF5691 domain-containing protein [Thainema sp.]